MSNRLLYLLLALSLGLNVGVGAMTVLNMTQKRPVLPHGPVGGPGHQPGAPQDPLDMIYGHLEGMTRHLGLDESQQQAVRAVLDRHAPLLVELQLEVDETGRRLTEAFAAADFDAEHFKALTAEASLARSRLDSLSAVMLTAEAACLTTEQRRMFAEVATTVHSRPSGPPKGPRGRRGPRHPHSPPEGSR